MRLLRLLFVTTAALIATGCKAEGALKRVNLGGESLCFPKEYSPKFSFPISYMTRDVPESDDVELIFIPADLVRRHVPEFTIGHANQYTSNVPHNLTGIAYGKNAQGRPLDLASIAWHIASSGNKYYVVPDQENGYFRIYEHSNPSFMWYLVASPPPASAHGSPPANWYIGSCLEEPGGYSCKQSVTYRSMLYEYELDKRDLALRDSVSAFVKKTIAEWHSSCEG